MKQGQRTMLGVGLAAALVTAACGGSVSTGGSGGQGSGSTSTSTSGSGSGNSSGSGSGSGSSSGAGGGTSCGGFAGAVCAADEFCDYFDDTCGIADGQGVCRKRPMGCTKEYNPVCACDGMVYGNECQGNSAGTDISNVGGCPAPGGSFGCGAHFCSLGAQYCQHTPSDVGNSPDSYLCIAAPAACGGKASCACLGAHPCANMCTALPSGGIEITCPGG